MSPSLSDLPKVLKGLKREAERIKKEGKKIEINKDIDNTLDNIHNTIIEYLEGEKNISAFYKYFKTNFLEEDKLSESIKIIMKNKEKYKEDFPNTVKKAKFVLGEVIFICMPQSSIAVKFMQEGSKGIEGYSHAEFNPRYQKNLREGRISMGSWENLSNPERLNIYLPGESSKPEDRKDNMIKGLKTLKKIINEIMGSSGGTIKLETSGGGILPF